MASLNLKFFYILIILLINLYTSNQKLTTPDLLKNLKQQRLKDVEELQIPQSTCNVVDPTPILPPGMKASQFISRSGFLKVKKKRNSALGFIFWGSMAAKGDISKLKDFPTFIWLQGGPGASSQYGNFGEMGPIFVGGNSPNYNYVFNKYSWTQKYNMIFIDQPLGAGLSYTPEDDFIPTDQSEVAFDLYAALQQLYESDNGCFKQLNIQNTPLFISGESYAGKFVPSITSYILAQRTQQSIIKRALLKGASIIGDGFIYPKMIINTLPSFAYKLSLINKYQKEQLEEIVETANQFMENDDYLQAQYKFWNVLSTIQTSAGLFGSHSWTALQDYPNPFSLADWLNSTNIKTDIFKFPEQIQFSGESQRVFDSLGSDFMKDSARKSISHILEQNFPMFFYQGQTDLIVCTPCTTNWIDEILYQDQYDFKHSKYQTWNTIDSKKVAGYWKQARNLAFATINKAGHGAPGDQPEAAYTAITQFVDFAIQRNQAKNKYEFDKHNQVFNMQNSMNEDNYNNNYNINQFNEQQTLN